MGGILVMQFSDVDFLVYLVMAKACNSFYKLVDAVILHSYM